MTSQTTHLFRQLGRAALAFLIVSTIIALSGGFARPAVASEISVKMVRQIGIMEKIMDKLLLDSKYFLVHGGSDTRGLYISEFGVLFSFDASLTDGRRYLNQIFKDQGFEVKTDKDGNQVIVLKDKNKNKDKNGGKAGSSSEDEESGEVSDSEASGASDEDVSQRTYEQGKEELIQCLLDYGETMTSVPDGQWLGIAAFLDRVDFLKDTGLSRLFIKAKMADLRAFGAGRISDSEMKSRIEVEEY